MFKFKKHISILRCYGVLPGLQSYSTLPYGNDIFNYAVNLSKSIFNLDRLFLVFFSKI